MQLEAWISGEIQEKKKSINTVATSHLGNLLKTQIIDLCYKILISIISLGLEMNSLGYLEENEAMFFIG